MPTAMDKKELKPLTKRQQLFVNEYVKDYNGAQAAIRAGYSKKAAKEAAYELLTYPHVQYALEVRMQQINAKTEATVEDVRKFWLETMLDENSNKSDRLRASELIAKDKGIFVQNSANIAIFNGLQGKDLAFLDEKVKNVLEAKIAKNNEQLPKQLLNDADLDENTQKNN